LRLPLSLDAELLEEESESESEEEFDEEELELSRLFF